MEAVNLKQLRRNLFGISSERKVKRSLFGEVDHEEVKKDLEREFKETLEEKSKLWNFDFEKYCPRGDIVENGLQWTAYPITEQSMEERRSYVSTSFNESIPTTRLVTTTEIITNISRKSISPAKNILSSATPDVIEIINGSPIRNLTPPQKQTTPIEKSSVQFDITKTLITTRAGKRKRSSQATIDDFMKKKKPRTNMEFHSSTKKNPSSISSRLRSSPSKVQVIV